MNFFKSKDPDIEEISRENRVKKGIVKEFASILKSVQVTHSRTDEPVYSSDCSTQLCYAFEVVFLHGLKVAQKLYQLSATELLHCQCSYWSFVQRFTHKDVLSQLKTLSHVKTEVGLCRAWVKLAINDGLMESYLTAMLAQPNTVRQYYRRTAFLRDSEQPGILIQLLQILNLYNFQLVYNSAALNTWGLTTLCLAGYTSKTVAIDSSLPELSQHAEDMRFRTGTLTMDDIPDISQFTTISNQKTSRTSSVNTQDDEYKVPSAPIVELDGEEAIQQKSSTDPASSSSRSSSSYSAQQTLAMLKQVDYTFDEVIASSDQKVVDDCSDFFMASEVSDSAQSCEANTPDNQVTEMGESLCAEMASNNADKHLSIPNQTASDVPGFDSVSPLGAATFCIGSVDTEYLASAEHSEADSKPGSFVEREDNSDDDIEDDTLILERSASNLKIDKKGDNATLQLPASSAQAIMQKRLSGTAESLKHGNSLSSLTAGWSSDAELAKSLPLKPTVFGLGQVQSFADLVSEYTSGDDTLGSPVTDYSTLVSQKLGSSAKDQNVNENEILSEEVDGKAAYDDFEVIGTIDKDANIEILKCYGEICREKGLDSQNFQCFSCSRPIGIIYGAARVCAYNARYHCVECHLMEEAYIPSKIACNWDFRKFKVATATKDFLTSAESMPLLNIKYINPRLYTHVPELGKCKSLRMQLYYLRRYLVACTPEIADEMKGLFWLKEYLYEEIHTYSVQDLLSVAAGPALINQMKKGVKFASNHVKSCQSCQYKGFQCEICNSPKVIFLFDMQSTTQCEKCNAVFHVSCLTGDCPKCERIRQRNELLGSNNTGAVDFTFDE